MSFDLDTALERALQPLQLLAQNEIAQAQFERNRRLNEEDRARQQQREDRIRAESRANQLADEARERRQQTDDAEVNRQHALSIQSNAFKAQEESDARREKSDKSKREEARQESRKEFYRHAGYTPDAKLSDDANDAAAIASGTTKFKNLLSAKSKYLAEIESLLDQTSVDNSAKVAKALANDPQLLAEKILTKAQMDGLANGTITPRDLIQALPTDKASIVADRYQELLNTQTQTANTVISSKARLRLTELQSKTDGLNAAIQNLARHLPAASLGDAFVPEVLADGHSASRDPAVDFIQSKTAAALQPPPAITPEFAEPVQETRQRDAERLKNEIQGLENERANLLTKINSGGTTVSGADFGEMTLPHSEEQAASFRQRGRQLDASLGEKRKALATLQPAVGMGDVRMMERTSEATPPSARTTAMGMTRLSQLAGVDLATLTPQEQDAMKAAALKDGLSIAQIQDVVARVQMGDPQALQMVGQYLNRIRSQKSSASLQPLSVP